MATLSEKKKWLEEFYADDSEFSKWRKKNEKLLAEFRESSDFNKELSFAEARFWLEKYSAGWDEAFGLLDRKTDLIDQLLQDVRKARTSGEWKGQVETLLAYSNEIAAFAKQRAALARGRALGAQKKRDRAKENRASLDKAISDLFTGPEKKGFQWSNQQITDFLACRFRSGYSRGTILKAVKRIAPQHRKAARQNQA